MKNTHKCTLSARIVAIILIFALMTPIGASAVEIQPRASDYLTSYGAYIYRPASGTIQVYFNVAGTNYMDELGVLSISLYESTDGGTTWTWKKTFTHDSTSGMLSYNDNYHSGYVTYYGWPSRQYKALVCVWGGKDGQGDTRYFWAYEV